MLGLGSLTYNLYLDKQNVNDMKNLLTAFEQLESDLETETGERFTIEASCESVGKFAESYGCNVYLKNDTNTLYNYTNLDNSNQSYRCRIIDSPDAKYLNFYACSITVRNSNRNAAEEIFYKYDTTPGSAF